MAWTPTTSFETTDGSTTPTDGNTVTGTGDGAGWTGNWTEFNATTGYYMYDNGVASIPDGSWAMNCDTGAANREPGQYRQISSAVVSGNFSFRFRCNKENRDQMGPFAYSTGAAGTRYWYLLFTQVVDGNGRNLADSGGTIASGVIFKNTWYEVEIDFDCTTDTYDVYVDGVKQNGAARNFENAATSIPYVTFRNNAASATGSSAGNSHWYDQLADGDAAPPVVNIRKRRRFRLWW